MSNVDRTAELGQCLNKPGDRLTVRNAIITVAIVAFVIFFHSARAETAKTQEFIDRAIRNAQAGCKWKANNTSDYIYGRCMQRERQSIATMVAIAHRGWLEEVNWCIQRGAEHSEVYFEGEFHGPENMQGLYYTNLLDWCILPKISSSPKYLEKLPR